MKQFFSIAFRAALVLIPLVLIGAGAWLRYGLPAALISVGALMWLDLWFGMWLTPRKSGNLK